VPHLRDSFIVAKVGIREANRTPFVSPDISEKALIEPNPKTCQAPTGENLRQTPAFACPISFIPQAILDTEHRAGPDIPSRGHHSLSQRSCLERGLCLQSI
jgi:hypothetical protein